MKKQTSNTARAELARLVAAVIAHPDTPVGLYNAMVEQLNDFTDFDFTDAEVVERLLANAPTEKKEGAR
jgi:hypothetical protein